MKKIILITIMLSIVILASSLVLGQCPDGMISYYRFEEDFDDDFSGSDIDTSKWAISNGVSLNNGKLNLLGTNEWIRSRDLWVLKGDFDVQIDFSDLDLSSGDGNKGVYFRINGDSHRDYFTEIARLKLFSNNIYRRVDNGGTWSAGSQVSTSHTSGKFRITRTNSIFNAYYWSGSNWVLLGAPSNTWTYSGDVFINLFIWSSDDPSSVDFDNFKINKGAPVLDSKGSNVGSNQGATLTTGKLGNALSFDGSGSFVGIPHTSSLSLPGDFSILAWVNFNDLYRSAILGKGSSLQTNNYFLGTGSHNAILFGAGTGSDYFHSVHGFNSVNNWHLVSGVKSGNNYDIYVDGQKVRSNVYTGNPNLNSNLVTIGLFYEQGTHYNFKGSIDEVAIYNRALSSFEIRELYSASGDKNLDYCSDFKPIATSFSGTDINTIPDLTNASNFEIINNQGSVKWNNPLNLVGENLDSNINLGMNFVSLNTIGLDSTLDSEANITFMVDGCKNARVYYVDSGFYDNLNDIKTNGIICPENICSNINCDGNTLTFTAAHFDGFGGEGDPVGDPVIPEFNLMGIILVIIIASTGLYFISRRN